MDTDYLVRNIHSETTAGGGMVVDLLSGPGTLQAGVMSVRFRESFHAGVRNSRVEVARELANKRLPIDPAAPLSPDRQSSG